MWFYFEPFDERIPRPIKLQPQYFGWQLLSRTIGNCEEIAVECRKHPPFLAKLGRNLRII